MDALVQRFGGNAALVRELIALFVEDCPRMLAEVRGSVDAGCADRIRRSAHSCKGAVGNFTTGPAFDAALALERLGRSGDVAGAPAALAALEREVTALLRAMHRFTEESVCAS